MARASGKSNFNIFLFMERTKKEAKALNQLMFSGFYNTVFVILPAYISLIAYFFFRNPKITSNSAKVLVIDYQADGISDFLLIFKLTLVFMAGFLILYRWSTNLKNGNYGYWLTLGIKREVLFLFVLVSVSLRLVVGFLIPFSFIIVVTGIQLPLLDMLFLIILEIISIVFIVAFSLFLAELIEVSELAVSTLFILYSIMFLIQGTLLYYLRLFLIGEFEYNSDLTLQALIFGIIGTIGFGFGGFYLHKYQDIEL